MTDIVNEALNEEDRIYTDHPQNDYLSRKQQKLARIGKMLNVRLEIDYFTDF
ncbi:unnamed protein product [Anisakis simplex]|uniref:Uncharacterized protein n=1 Tax=Anisakis simplex TaxID=6269 RepID=A0A3P6STV1_ANISI|nr:unnamed protein product [Anisakis simplex]